MAKRGRLKKGFLFFAGGRFVLKFLFCIKTDDAGVVESGLRAVFGQFGRALGRTSGFIVD